jgi:hypothetical protein
MNSFLKSAILATTKIIPDRIYLEIAYRIVAGKKLHLNSPKTYNEKMQWLKLYNRRPEYIQMVDKYEVRKFVTECVGAQYLIPLLGVWDKTEEIDFSLLPAKFVLKCTHDSHGIVICNEKSHLDISKARAILDKGLSSNFYYQGREWPYKYVKPRIIAEKYMENPGENQLTDYKVYTFNGKAKFIQVDFDRFTNHRRQFYSTDWVQLDISWHIKSDRVKKIPKPSVLNQVIKLSEGLSKGIPHLRTDFYIIGSMVYIGEMTFYSGSGFGKWTPDSFDAEMGGWLDLSPLREGEIR